MTYATIVALSYALHYSSESQARAVKEAQLETRLVEARLRTLEAELHPHFLFNTLHAISTLVHTDPDAADRMISRLSDLLRLTFDRSGRRGVRCRKNWSSCRSISRSSRPASRIGCRFDFDIDPETLDAEVPRLILQPLVENAIKHGVSPKSGAGLVQIASRRKAEKLWIEVRDNGVGLGTAAGAPHARRRPVQHARPARVPLRRRRTGSTSRTRHDGLAVQMLIPLQRASPSAADPPHFISHDHSGNGRTRVLVADDEPLARERLRIAARARGLARDRGRVPERPEAIAAIRHSSARSRVPRRADAGRRRASM